jgi:hypothetical protein
MFLVCDLIASKLLLLVFNQMLAAVGELVAFSDMHVTFWGMLQFLDFLK